MKRNEILRICGVFLLGCVAALLATGIYVLPEAQRESYDSGYFHGWFESTFIDCSLPSINQSLHVVPEDTNNQFYLDWEDACSRLVQKLEEVKE